MAKEPAEKLYDGIRKVRVAMMVLPDQQGELRAMPMYSMKADDDGTLWFFTSLSSEKTTEIAINGTVNLAYADPGSNFYASVTGGAEVLDDHAQVEKLWSEWARPWFPKGKDDPDLALIKVKPHRGEYWDSPSSTVVQLYGYVKAQLTGKPPTELTENAKVSL